jgi:hypothetical protein
MVASLIGPALRSHPGHISTPLKRPTPVSRPRSVVATSSIMACRFVCTAIFFAVDDADEQWVEFTIGSRGLEPGRE